MHTVFSSFLSSVWDYTFQSYMPFVVDKLDLLILHTFCLGTTTFQLWSIFILYVSHFNYEELGLNCQLSGKEKSPELDDGGTGLPPRDDDGGGGGGGGGGGPNWSGGFFFFGFLALLGLLKDQESEGPYRDNRRR